MTAKEVEIALGAAPAEVGSDLLKAHEDQWFDRKSARTNPKDLAQPLIALANAEGGVIVMGLHNGVVEGIADQGSMLNAIRQAPIDFTVPPVRASFAELPCVNRKGERDNLLVIRVDPSERVHEARNGDCYLRVGDESRKLTFTQRQELEFDKGQSQYDGLVAQGINIPDLNGKLLHQYKKATSARANTATLLRNRSLLTRKNEVTNAGYLLFGDHPQDLFPQAHIRILRFLTTQRGTGARLGLDEEADTRIDGPIPYAIQQATTMVEDLMPRRRSLQASGKFEGNPIVPRDAWLEGLVNAVIHRSYSLAGDHIRVEIYPDRIEIESPGRFPGLANPQQPLEISRFARNPRIARVCADLRIGQELGEGIKRIFEEMQRVGLTDPVYKQSAGSVRLKLAAIQRLDPKVAARLPFGSERVLDLIRAAGTPLGTGEIEAAIGRSRPATLSRLRALESENLIRWVGKSTKDPRAVWELVDP